MPALRVRYATFEFPEFDIHVRSLWDKQQYSDADGEAEALGISSAAWPLFGQLWAGGHVLARIMASRDVEGLQILEVGCGIGLSSLVLNHRGADITATDHHPEAGRFLDANTALNGDDEIPFVRAGWADLDTDLGRFDLIVAADILYDHHEVDGLARFMLRHCRADGQVVVVDPGRKPRARFVKTMKSLGFTHETRAAEPHEADLDQTTHVMTFDLPAGSPALGT